MNQLLNCTELSVYSIAKALQKRDREVMYNIRRLSVWLSGCLSVCLLITATCKKYWSDFRENFATDLSLEREELIKFWKSSPSGSESRNIFWRFFNNATWSIFSTVWFKSPEKAGRIFIKNFARVVSSEKEVNVRF